MSYISTANLAFQYPSTDNLFENLSFSVNPGDRIAIAGPNGSGKTTLLHLLEGLLAPTAGTIVRRHGIVFAKAAQSIDAAPDQPLLDFVLATRPRLAELRSQLSRLEASFAESDPLEYAAALHEYLEAGGYEADALAAKILAGLGLSEAETRLEMGKLSGGQQRRAVLARALYAPCDVLLLDEPTNHLDSEGRLWLAEELARRPQACVVVSHDRALLRVFANKVIDIDRRSSSVFEGGYDEWRAAKDLRNRQAWAEYEGAQRRQAAAQQAARRRAELASRVAAPPPDARQSHDFYRAKAARIARTARMLRERAAVAGEVKKPWEEQSIPRLAFEHVSASGGFPVSARGLSKSFGERVLFTGVDIDVARGARWAITGPNGSGKTTLLKILAGLERPDEGRVIRAPGTRIACLTQDSAHLDPAFTPLEICGSSTIARTLMGCLKLRPDCVNRPLGELSPGERTKVALVQVLTGNANTLLLDEPTEHLEVEAQEALEQALAGFPGALVVISHDRAFLDSFGPELRRLELGKEPAPRLSFAPVVRSASS